VLVPNVRLEMTTKVTVKENTNCHTLESSHGV
jgi:hypothetical protein